MAESFILCAHQAFKTHIKNIAVFIHKDNRMEVAHSRFTNKIGEGDLTRLESGMTFLQVRVFISMKEKLRQAMGAICMNRREIAHTRLEAIAGADNPYSLITIFGRGHIAIKPGAPYMSHGVHQWRYYPDPTETARRRSRSWSMVQRHL
jgi:hypothetical protein